MHTNFDEREAMNMIQKTTSSLVAPMLAAALLCAAAPGGARENPEDPVSNPDKLSYSDVEAHRPDFREPFLRDGVASQPERFRAIRTGLAQAQVLAMLGQQLTQRGGTNGTEWDYNIKFRMPHSGNYLVCQYKVVFDGSQAVRDAVWRRRQCLDQVR